MTQEEKQLLLKDICARIPYRVKFQGEDSNVYTLDAANYFALQIEDMVFKPYLRPMSSMTEEEEEEFRNSCNIIGFYKDGEFACTPDGYDWLNEHHFDYRGLIEKSLALVAPEGMYEV